MKALNTESDLLITVVVFRGIFGLLVPSDAVQNEGSDEKDDGTNAPYRTCVYMGVDKIDYTPQQQGDEGNNPQHFVFFHGYTTFR